MTAHPSEQIDRSVTTGRNPLAAVAGVGSLMVLIGAVLTGIVVRTQQPELLERAGPVALVVAVLLGMPHGALDTELVAQGRTRRALTGAAYLGGAGLVYAAWTQRPAAAVAVLLGVSAVHFAWIDHVVSRWRTPAGAVRAHAGRAAATGALAVAGPFAWWPRRAGPLLGQLGVDPTHWPVFTDISRGVFAAAVVVGLVATISALLDRDTAGALEPLAVGAVTVVLPPLLGFAVYFAGWHAWRQSCRLVAVHPDGRRCRQRYPDSSATSTVARRAALPTAFALAVVSALVVSAHDVPAGVLVALLAVSVPHAAVGVLSERRTAGSTSGSAT